MIPVGPRSQTLLNPIAVLLGAYAEGHISSYYDVIELSHAALNHNRRNQ